MKKYIIDVDGTICYTVGQDYENAKPFPDRIEKINQLYDQGHEINYWTARGYVSRLNWLELTMKQFEQWGVKYHSLKVGTKPNYDVWIDDKAIHSSDFFGDQLNDIEDLL